MSSLVLCCKAPLRSKTRLAEDLGEGAIAAAGHLLDCALEDLRDWPGEAVLAPASEADAEWFGTTSNAPFDSVVQSGGSLGERIGHVDRRLRRRGHERLLYIGTDCPALDRDYLACADAALDAHDAVLGPATDGGVVLMGAKKPWPPIGDLAWSTPALLEDLSRRLDAHGWTLTILDTLPDVDTVEDLGTAAAKLVDDERPGRRALLDWLHARELARGAIT